MVEFDESEASDEDLADNPDQATHLANHLGVKPNLLLDHIRGPNPVSCRGSHNQEPLPVIAEEEDAGEEHKEISQSSNDSGDSDSSLNS